MERGWSARGTNFGDTVTDSGWEEFQRQGQRAIKALKRAEPLNPRDPEYFATLVSLLSAHGGSDADKENAFRRGVTIEPTYFPLYANRPLYLER